MKILQIVSWDFLAIELLLVTLMFDFPNVGDEAARRRMGRGFVIVLLPIVLLSSGLLPWSQNSDSKMLHWTAIAAVTLPFCIGAAFFGRATWPRSWAIESERACHRQTRQLRDRVEAPDQPADARIESVNITVSPAGPSERSIRSCICGCNTSAYPAGSATCPAGPYETRGDALRLFTSRAGLQVVDVSGS